MPLGELVLEEDDDEAGGAIPEEEDAKSYPIPETPGGREEDGGL